MKRMSGMTPITTFSSAHFQAWNLSCSLFQLWHYMVCRGFELFWAVFHPWLCLGLCLQSPLRIFTLPDLNKNMFPLSEKLAVYDSSSILSCIAFVELFPVYVLAFLHCFKTRHNILGCMGYASAQQTKIRHIYTSSWGLYAKINWSKLV